jgi:hypothetical protein
MAELPDHPKVLRNYLPTNTASYPGELAFLTMPFAHIKVLDSRSTKETTYRRTLSIIVTDFL